MGLVRGEDLEGWCSFVEGELKNGLGVGKLNGDKSFGVIP